MEFRNSEESKEARAEDSKMEPERNYFGCGNESEEAEYKSVHGTPKDGTVAPKPGDVRNGDLVSLLLAATPPYLYNIPLVPQTFFFSEMLKSFVQAKTERQNFKAQQSHHRRQRKRSWREASPPKPTPYEARDKPLELTTPKQTDDKGKLLEKSPAKKFHPDNGDKKYSELGSSNFSVEKLANSSISSGSDAAANARITAGDAVPPAPPLWYPLLYPPHPPYGIDPLHFFIDLRVSAHFWDRKLATEKISNETALTPPLNLHAGDEAPGSAIGKGRHNSAFRVPAARTETLPPKDPAKKSSRNVHYVISSLKDIYRALDERDGKGKGEEGEREEEADEGEERDADEKKCKDLRALIGLELVVDYVKQESDEEDEKSELSNPEPEVQTVCTEE